MFNEYDVVKSKIKLSESVLEGTKGAIVMVHDSKAQEYEVEFVDLNGDTVELLTVSNDDLELIQSFEK